MIDPFAFDPLQQRYPSQRFPLYARGGMVNCSCPQAAAAGLEVLRPRRAWRSCAGAATPWTRRWRRPPP